MPCFLCWLYYPIVTLTLVVSQCWIYWMLKLIFNNHKLLRANMCCFCSVLLEVLYMYMVEFLFSEEIKAQSFVSGTSELLILLQLSRPFWWVAWHYLDNWILSQEDRVRVKKGWRVQTSSQSHRVKPNIRIHLKWRRTTWPGGHSQFRFLLNLNKVNFCRPAQVIIQLLQLIS